jgi:hypothetical protein
MSTAQIRPLWNPDLVLLVTGDVKHALGRPIVAATETDPPGAVVDEGGSHTTVDGSSAVVTRRAATRRLTVLASELVRVPFLGNAGPWTRPPLGR